jgi:hypothetical protein
VSIDQADIDYMEAEAKAWWKKRGAFEMLSITGAADDVEAERRWAAINTSDRWHLSQGHIKSVEHFNWAAGQ